MEAEEEVSCKPEMEGAFGNRRADNGNTGKGNALHSVSLDFRKELV